MSANTLLTVLASLMALVITAAGAFGAWAALKTGRNVSTAKVYQEAADAWQRKSELQSQEILELQHQNEEQARQLEKLQTEITVLKGVVTGRSAIEALGADLVKWHADLLLEIRLNREAIQQAFNGEGK